MRHFSLGPAHGNHRCSVGHKTPYGARHDTTIQPEESTLFFYHQSHTSHNWKVPSNKTHIVNLLQLQTEETPYKIQIYLKEMNCPEIASWFLLEIRWYITWLNVPPSFPFIVLVCTLLWVISFFFFFFFFSFFFQTSLSFKCHIVCDCDWALESFGDLFTYYCSWVTSTLLIPAKQANKKLWELIFPIDHGHRIRNLSIKRKKFLCTYLP